MNWTRVNRELVITDSQRSGYDYRIRAQVDGGAILIAEGRAIGRPAHRQECRDVIAAMELAEQWESAGVPVGTLNVPRGYVYPYSCPCAVCVAYRAGMGHSGVTYAGRMTCSACPHLVHAGDCDHCPCHYEPNEVTP